MSGFTAHYLWSPNGTETTDRTRDTRTVGGYDEDEFCSRRRLDRRPASSGRPTRSLEDRLPDVRRKRREIRTKRVAQNIMTRS